MHDDPASRKSAAMAPWRLSFCWCVAGLLIVREATISGDRRSSGLEKEVARDAKVESFNKKLVQDSGIFRRAGNERRRRQEAGCRDMHRRADRTIVVG